MQQGGQYSFYSSGAPISDPAQLYMNNVPIHGSAPPYTAPPSNYSPVPFDSSYQNPETLPYAPQAPPYMPPQPSLSDSLAALNISSQGSYIPSPNPYAPTVPSYEQSFNQQIASPNVYHTPASAHASNYPTTGQSYSGIAQSPGPSQGYDAASRVGPYANSPQLGYDYSSTTAQSNPSSYEQGGGIYNQARNFDRPAFVQQASSTNSSYDKYGGSNYPSMKGGYDFEDVGVGDVLAYDGGSVEPYGARGTGSASWRALDTYNSSAQSGSFSLPKAVPKVDKEERDNGVQKYRVKMLSDSSSANGPVDVLCQIGLDGVRMFSPSTGKIVKIYPLESITRWEVNEPSVFTFWAKSAVDIEPRRIRLQSGSYTTNAILDTLTAACVQFSEMVGKDGSFDSSKVSGDAGKGLELTMEKRRSNFAAWMTLKNRQSVQEEKDHWVPDEAVTKCSACSTDFGAFLRRHHCRNCGDIFCDKCTHGRIALTAEEDAPVVRVCDRCLAEVTQRLSNAKQSSTKPPPPRSHDDLAKKLQEELERNAPRRSTTGSGSSHGKERSGQTTVLNCNACGSISLVSEGSTKCTACGVDSSRSRRERSAVSRGSSNSWSTQGSFEATGRKMREVACPTCTVHLQVHVPTSGTETVECDVCQHPFLVNAH